MSSCRISGLRVVGDYVKREDRTNEWVQFLRDIP